MRLNERFQITRPLEEMELSLVRAAQSSSSLLNPIEEAVLRTALSLARMYKVRHSGRDVGVGAFLAPFREGVSKRLAPVLLGSGPPRREQLLPLIADLKEQTLRTREELIRRNSHRLPEEAIDRELRHKALVLVSGGGGGTGYVYVGVMAALEDFGLRPALLVGTSIGAVLSLFRSRLTHFDQTEMMNIVRGLSWRKLFRVISADSQYGLPAALRLFLRAGIGRFFSRADDAEPGMRLSDLPVPTIITVTGIRRGMLPRPLEFYERALSLSPRSLLNPAAMVRGLGAAMGAVTELIARPEILVKLHLGADAATRDFDALDAAGFSSALPGVIHYDVLREDPRMHVMLNELLDSHGVSRLVDGGLVDNLPARAAWRAVHKGHVGTRNAFILALNGFCSKLTTPLWLPLQRAAEINVAPNRPYAHLTKDFKKTLSPLDLVPSVDMLARAVDLGRKQMTEDIPLLARMLAPLPRLLKTGLGFD